jgi:IMP dehydrogenase
MKIADSMKKQVISIPITATVKDAVELFLKHHIGTLPVVDENNKLVGLLRLPTVLSLVMPDFVRLMDNFEFVHDFGALDGRQPSDEDLTRPIRDIMERPYYVTDDSSLLYVSAIINKHKVRDIPVVDRRSRLVGLASHVDVGTALMRNWHVEES